MCYNSLFFSALRGVGWAARTPLIMGLLGEVRDGSNPKKFDKTWKAALGSKNNLVR